LPPPATSAGAGTEEDEKRTKRELQRWFDIISTNPILIRDEEVMLFVESDFGVISPETWGMKFAVLTTL